MLAERSVSIAGIAFDPYTVIAADTYYGEFFGASSA